MELSYKLNDSRPYLFSQLDKDALEVIYEYEADGVTPKALSDSGFNEPDVAFIMRLYVPFRTKASVTVGATEFYLDNIYRFTVDGQTVTRNITEVLKPGGILLIDTERIEVSDVNSQGKVTAVAPTTKFHRAGRPAGLIRRDGDTLVSDGSFSFTTIDYGGTLIETGVIYKQGTTPEPDFGAEGSWEVEIQLTDLNGDKITYPRPMDERIIVNIVRDLENL